jgi:hypothetical protein
MSADATAEGADGLTCLPDARTYYRTRLVGAHTIDCRSKRVDIVFEPDGTHLYSVAVDDISTIPNTELVTRDCGGGRRECRRFDLDRARLMDRVLPAISGFTRCALDKGARSRQPVLLHGPKLQCGRFMRVILRHGPGKSWVCVTAFPVDEAAHRSASWLKPAQFP